MKNEKSKVFKDDSSEISGFGMRLKQKVHEHCTNLLNAKILSLKNALFELSEGAKNDSKSSAGDKHETARAMMQIEQEKLSKQLNEASEQQAILDRIDSTNESPQIIKGSLIKTNNGFIYLSIALGKIKIDNENIIVLSPQSPLGTKLMGLNKNDKAEINGVNYIIEEVF